MYYFLEGLLIGLAYLAPIGMQNLYVINTAINHNRHRAIISALIVIFFDITLSLSCFFGIGTMIDYFSALKLIMLSLGSILLIYIGYKLIQHPALNTNNDTVPLSFTQTIYKSCVVTWCNPQAIVDGTIMLGAFHALFNNNQAILFLSGIISASFIWFIGLSFLVSTFKHKISRTIFARINLACGIVIIFYGLKLFYELGSTFITNKNIL